jgi:predicted lactoylglutathione lyase
MFFVTIPVADVARSRAFFTALGLDFDPAFSGDGAACLIVGNDARAMLGSHETFAQVSHLPMADPATHALALFSFSVDSREEVDSVAATALELGAREADGAEDHGFMYTRSFFDLDGHGWQVMWMDPAAMPGAEQPEVVSQPT